MQVTVYDTGTENPWIRIYVAGKVIVLTANEARELRRQLSQVLGEIETARTMLTRRNLTDG